jgi:hypothetical protein
LDWADADVPASNRLQAIQNAVLIRVKLSTGLQKARNVEKKKRVMVWAGEQSKPLG